MTAVAAPVAVIVVSWNRRELLLDCLDSLMRQTLPPAEVIVVDNGSTDGSAQAVERLFGVGAPAPLRVIRSDINLGFAAGNNLGAAAATAPWLALLNNDAAADPRWLEEMMKAAGPRAGLIACRLLRAERRDLLDNAGVRLWFDGMSRGAFHYFRDAEVQEPEALLPSGAAMMVRREAFEAVGGFDESFFAYSEDTDLGIRVRLAGWGCAWADRAYVYHRGGGGTLGVVSLRKIYLVERNRLRILLRYYPGWLLVLGIPLAKLRHAALAGAMLRGAIRRPKTKNPNRDGGAGQGMSVGAGLRALFQAYRDCWRGRAADLAVRRQWPGGPAFIKAALDRRLDFASLTRLEADE